MHTWDPEDYARHSATQEQWARDCLQRLALRGDERVLDIGCGDGRMTAELAARVPRGSLLGVDLSPEMVAHARREYGPRPHANLAFAVADAARLPYDGGFDLVVSFTCLHWVADQSAVLRGIARALEPGGRFFLQFGGRGNVASMRAVVDEVTAGEPWRQWFEGFAFPYTFPGAEDYRGLVERAGLRPTRVELVRRDMRHAGADELAGWLRTTWLPYLDRLPEERRAAFVDAVVSAYLEAEPPDERGQLRVVAIRLEAEGTR